MKLANGAFFPVKGVLASDADKDLAVIKVDGKNLPFLTFAEMNQLHVGDHVVAIGSPLGLEGTVSDGIVSAVRDVEKEKWIQTTAPVSHGNSGGCEALLCTLHEQRCEECQRVFCEGCYVDHEEQVHRKKPSGREANPPEKRRTA